MSNQKQKVNGSLRRTYRSVEKNNRKNYIGMQSRGMSQLQWSDWLHVISSRIIYEATALVYYYTGAIVNLEPIDRISDEKLKQVKRMEIKTINISAKRVIISFKRYIMSV